MDTDRRRGQRRLVLWFSLDADRRVLAGVLAVVVFGGLLLVGRAVPGGVPALRSGDPIETLFQAVLTATVTGVTLVLTLNQLVLSQELGPLGDQRDRVDAATDVRATVADAIDAPTAPARPAPFLRALVETAARHGERVADAVESEHAGDQLAREAETLRTRLAADAERVGDALDDAAFGGFAVVSAALRFDYSRRLVAAERIAGRDELSVEAASALDDVTEALELFGAAREHVKTLYFQWALIDLSRAISVAALPALLVSVVMITVFEPARLGDTALLAVVAAATTVGLLPFFVLLAYIARIASVAKETLAAGPFVLRDTTETPAVEWEE